MRGINPERLDHLADGVLSPDAFVFPDYFCNRLCGAVVDHGITWRNTTRNIVYGN
jgi:hypothetical protein